MRGVELSGAAVSMVQTDRMIENAVDSARISSFGGSAEELMFQT